MDCYDWKYCPGNCDECEIYTELEAERQTICELAEDFECQLTILMEKNK